jgi:hypothetical protein
LLPESAQMVQSHLYITAETCSCNTGQSSTLKRLLQLPPAFYQLINSIIATPGGRQAIINNTTSSSKTGKASSITLLKRCLERFQLLYTDDRERDIVIKAQVSVAFVTNTYIHACYVTRSTA